MQIDINPDQFSFHVLIIRIMLFYITGEKMQIIADKNRWREREKRKIQEKKNILVSLEHILVTGISADGRTKDIYTRSAEIMK